MRVLWLVLIAALIAGCGSGGGGNAVDEITTRSVKLILSTEGGSATTVVGGIDVVVDVPAGVTVTGTVVDPKLFSATQVVPATATSSGHLRLAAITATGFPVGNFATIDCTAPSTVSLTPSSFPLEGAKVIGPNAQPIPGVAVRIAVTTQ